MNGTDVAYLAGLVDGEGYIGIKKSKAYACQGRVTPGYHARIQVRMVDEQAIQFLTETLGGTYYKEKPHATNGRPLFCYSASDVKAEHILWTLLPYLRVKRAVARKVLVLCRLKRRGSRHRTRITGYRNFANAYGTPRRVANLAFSAEYVNWCDALWQQCKQLNKVGAA